LPNKQSTKQKNPKGNYAEIQDVSNRINVEPVKRERTKEEFKAREGCGDFKMLSGHSSSMRVIQGV